MIKNIIRFFFITLPRKYIERLGFINYYSYYINGPANNLVIKGNYQKNDFANTIFNTMSGKIILGEDILFSQNVMILTGKHNIESMDINIRKFNLHSNNNIIIEDGVWLAGGCTVVGNVKIGKFSVVMAGSVVTKDVPSYSIVGGVPAKFIKYIKGKENI